MVLALKKTLLNENKKQDKTICDDEHVHESLKSINYKKRGG
jgi:hypothetical protein